MNQTIQDALDLLNYLTDHGDDLSDAEETVSRRYHLTPRQEKELRDAYNDDLS